MKKATHIFIVDSNKLFVSLLGYIFTKSESYNFTEFESGEACLNNLHLSPSVIVLEYDLPGMNGYDTLLEIKEQFPSAKVIVLLKERNEEMEEKLMAAGAGEIVYRENGNFVNNIAGRIEDHLKNIAKPGRKLIASKRMYYYILILLLLTAGVYYYQ